MFFEVQYRTYVSNAYPGHLHFGDVQHEQSEQSGQTFTLLNPLLVLSSHKKRKQVVSKHILTIRTVHKEEARMKFLTNQSCCEPMGNANDCTQQQTPKRRVSAEASLLRTIKKMPENARHELAIQQMVNSPLMRRDNAFRKTVRRSSSASIKDNIRPNESLSLLDQSDDASSSRRCTRSISLGSVSS